MFKLAFHYLTAKVCMCHLHFICHAAGSTVTPFGSFDVCWITEGSHFCIALPGHIISCLAL
jgi:hypothetical protein